MANEQIQIGSPFCLEATRDPEPADSNYGDHFFWININSGDLFFCTQIIPDNAVWKKIGLA